MTDCYQASKDCQLEPEKAAPAFNWICGKKSFKIGVKPLIMGIVNATPDSICNAKKTKSDAIALASKMIEEGVDILDIGGESTRPGADPVAAPEELERILEVIQHIRNSWQGAVSVDTYKAPVAQEAIKAGADIINDVGSMDWDKNMPHIIRNSNVGYICMHSQGNPKTMQIQPRYNNVMNEVNQFFKQKLLFFDEQHISRERIALDVGIGFGKTLEHNLSLIRSASSFYVHGRPLVWGVSRKSFISQILNVPPEERLTGTLTTLAWLCSQKAPMIFRVHDAYHARQLIKMWDQFQNS